LAHRDCLDVIAVDGSRIVLEEYLARYEPRYHAACADFETWDRDNGDEWTPEHDRQMDVLAAKHHVCGPLISDTTFRIP
jgi:hypothetical protein